MAETVRVRALKAFPLNGKIVTRGMVSVPVEKVAGLVTRKLIAPPIREGASDEERIESAISHISATLKIEREAGESVADFLERLSGEAEMLSGRNTENSKQETDGDLERYTVVELKDMAKERNIAGYSTMNKQALIEALQSQA